MRASTAVASSTDSVIVALATAWGPKYGGINAFNSEIVKSLGILPTRRYELICAVLGPVTPELQEQLRLRFHVQLVSLEEESASEIVTRLDAAREPHRFIWIGHDDKTGPVALELKSRAPGSRAVLINHMAHGAYQSIKTGNSQSATEKRQRQLDLFSKADLCLAVGPMLHSHLQDALACAPKCPPVEMLVPGLVEPAEYDVSIRDAAPMNFVGFIAGRLDREDDRIKQGRLALRGFGKAVRDATEDSAIRRSPTLRMRGVRQPEEEPLRDLLMREAGRAVNFDFQDYTENRAVYFRDLASSSVAMMPSWHEGFGLVAWEAIGSAVPVVISDESGVYRLLKGECSGSGIGQSVAHVAVKGWLPASDEEPSHTADDVARVAEALLDIARRMPAAKQQALTLRRNLMALGFDWKGTALSLIGSIEKRLGVLLRAEHPALQATPPPNASSDASVAEWLRLPARRSWRPELQLPTSFLLAARDEIVRFDPERQPFLDGLLNWAREAGPLSARLLFGPGGIGKTRLALALARRLQEHGWSSLWLSSTPPETWIESWGEALRTCAHAGMLLVIDYADTRPTDVLQALSYTLEHLRGGAAGPVRLLFIARTKWWLASLSQLSNGSQDLAAWLATPNAIESTVAPAWSKDHMARLASYRLALEDYAAAVGLATPANAYVPLLSARAFDRPLYLHLAALAALEGQRPVSAEALLHNQLQREWRYWLGVHGKGVASYDDWADTLALIVLLEGTDPERVERALKTWGSDARALPTLLHRSYPAGDRIAALEPDLLAEALLRERLAGARGRALLDLVLTEQLDSALAVIGRLAAYYRPSDEPTAWARVLTDAIARHWPIQPLEWVVAARRAEYGLGEMLFEAWQQLDHPARATIATKLHAFGYSTNLAGVAVAVQRHELQIASDDGSRAAALSNLAGDLARFGGAASRDEALALMDEAVQILRLRAEARNEFLPALAGSLNNFSNFLAKRNDEALRARALTYAREAEQIYRQLSVADPAEHLRHFAGFLNTLATRLSAERDTASQSEAVALAREAVLISRQLSDMPDLAESLRNLAARLSEQCDAASHIEAVACAREALSIDQQLVSKEPVIFLPNLAYSFENLSESLRQTDNESMRVEALECMREAVSIWRQLAETDEFRSRLASALDRLGVLLQSPAEELSCAREAVAIFRKLAEKEPGIHLLQMGVSLANLAVKLSKQGQPDLDREALGCAYEATEIFRQFADVQPDASLAHLAESLRLLARLVPNKTECLRYASEAVQIYDRLIGITQASTYVVNFLSSLFELSKHFSAQVAAIPLADALEFARELVQTYAPFYKLYPDSFKQEMEEAVDILKRLEQTEGK